MIFVTVSDIHGSQLLVAMDYVSYYRSATL